jgi:hypothetical protein
MVDRREQMKRYWDEVRNGTRPKPIRKKTGIIKRKVRCDSNWLRDNVVVLTIHPEGYLTFQEPRCRAKYKLSLKEAFRQAVMISTAKITQRAKELRKNGMRRGALAKARREILA